MMMNDAQRTMLRNYGVLLGRVLLGLLFVVSGGGMLLVGAAPAISTVESLGLPLPVVLGWLVVLVKVLGGLALMAGYRVGVAAGALIVFTLLTVIFVHSDVADQGQQTQALKNLSIIGGLLYVMAYGAGEGWKLGGGTAAPAATSAPQSTPSDRMNPMDPM